MASNIRQRSEDRKPAVARDASQGREQYKDNGRHQPSFSTTGHTFLSNLRGTAAKGAGALSKGLFGKGGRSYSTNEREAPIEDEHYVFKVIKLPLVEQTRITRISKRLENSRDKTEFWMPALPWRAIDYLNYKGSDVEGLYRVPGSSAEIKKWQRKFDERKFSPSKDLAKTKFPQDTISISLSKKICTISISLAPCSSNGCVSFRILSFLRMLKIESPALPLVLRAYHKF